MSAVVYALSALLFVAGSIALVIATRVLLDAFALFHAAGMARVHHHNRKAHT